jgi:hypothetical protein
LHNGGSTMLTSSLLVGSCDGDVETSGGGNLESPGSTCALLGANDVSGVPALIGPLEDNGGPTLTHALLAASPAIDLALPGPCPAVDQRGVARPFDGDGDGRPDCDAGAFERTQPSLIFQNGFESGDTSGWSVVVD